jgi:hypothetical protein
MKKEKRKKKEKKKKKKKSSVVVYMSYPSLSLPVSMEQEKAVVFRRRRTS